MSATRTRLLRPTAAAAPTSPGAGSRSVSPVAGSRTSPSSAASAGSSNAPSPGCRGSNGWGPRYDRTERTTLPLLTLACTVINIRKLKKIEWLFAAGPSLHGIAAPLEPRAAVTDRVTDTISELDDAISQIRTTVFHLQQRRPRGPGTARNERGDPKTPSDPQGTPTVADPPGRPSRIRIDGPTSEQKPTTTLVLGHGRDAAGGHALQVAADLAHRMRAHLHVVHAVDLAVPLPGHRATHGSPSAARRRLRPTGFGGRRSGLIGPRFLDRTVADLRTRRRPAADPVAGPDGYDRRLPSVRPLGRDDSEAWTAPTRYQLSRCSYQCIRPPPQSGRRSMSGT